MPCINRLAKPRADVSPLMLSPSESKSKTETTGGVGARSRILLVLVLVGSGGKGRRDDWARPAACCAWVCARRAREGVELVVIFENESLRRLARDGRRDAVRAWAGSSGRGLCREEGREKAGKGMRGDPGVGVTALIVAWAIGLVGFGNVAGVLGWEAVRSTEWAHLLDTLGLWVSMDDWDVDVATEPVRGLESEHLGGPGGLAGGNIE
jgi:hypothetical protein